MTEFQTQQVLLPKKVYIGDSAELRCTFNSNSLSLKNFVNGESVQLSLEGFSGLLSTKDYDIQKISLSPAGVDFYQFSMTFVPWKTGTISFPPYNISLNFADPSGLNLNDSLEISFAPVNIVSLVEQNSITSMSPSEPPLLLPGTTYKLYGLLVILVILLLALIRAITKRDEIIFYLKNQKLLRKYKKNKKRTFKALNRLVKKGFSDYEHAGELQGILRNYLEVRFDYPFSKTVTSSFMTAFNSIFGGSDDFTSLMSEKKEEACIQMTAIFTRTDFIRYSGNSKFEEGEKLSLVEDAKACIENFEGSQKEAKNV